jgi:hypothetical protein
VSLQRVFETASHVDQNTMALQYLDMMRALGEGSSTKWVIPMDLVNAAAPLAGALAGMARPGTPTSGESTSTGP